MAGMFMASSTSSVTSYNTTVSTFYNMFGTLTLILLCIYVILGTCFIVSSTKTISEEKRVLKQCPKCHSVQIEYITEYHKSLSLRILAGAIIVIAAISSLSETASQTTIEDIMINLIVAIIVEIIIFAFTKLFIMLIEAKTHIRCICRSCGYTWTVN